MDRERLRSRIAEIARNPKHVRFAQLQRLLDVHIQPLVPNYNHHHKGSHHAFTVGAKTFTVPDRRPFVFNIYVMNFLDAMEALDLYEP
jgi:hypothetical protein